MAEDFTELMLEGATAGIDHYEKVTDPLKKHVKKITSYRRRDRRDEGTDYYSDDYSDDPEPTRRSTADQVRPRPDRLSGGGDRRYVVEEYERRRGRTLSTGADPYGGRGPGLRGPDHRYSVPHFYPANRISDYRIRYESGSDYSLSPPPNRIRRRTLGAQALAASDAKAADRDLEKRRNDLRRLNMSDSDNDRDRYRRDDRSRRADNFAVGTSTEQQRRKPAGYLNNGASDHNPDLRVANRKGNNALRDNGSSTRYSSSMSSSSSSDLCSSSEDEREIKKMKGKEYLSAGLAAVATIHAAKGLYSSLEARDRRYKELKNGEITPEEARRKRNKARLQDVAAIGIAALGIKGAYSEWQEVQEARHEVAAQKTTRKKRHEKRVKLREREAKSGGRSRDGYRSA